MKIVNIHDAKTQLSKLVQRAADGEPFVIARAGRPLVKVVPLDAPSRVQRRGFLSGRISVPKDFDRLGADEIETMFEG